MMRLNVRAKFTGILVIAAVLPLALALLVMGIAGYKHYRNAQGQLFRTSAEYLAHSLGLALGKQVRDLEDYAWLGDLYSKKGTTLQQGQDWKGLEIAWPDLPADSPQVKPYLSNPLAADLLRYRSYNWLMAELLVADSEGRLIAATAKTTDFFQGDERWWQEATSQMRGQAWVEGLSFDSSSGVYSMDIAVPLRDPNAPDGKPVGALKGVVDARPLFAGLRPLAERLPGSAVLADSKGHILYQFAGDKGQGLAGEMKGDLKAFALSSQSGWRYVRGDTESENMVIGFSPVKPMDARQEELSISGFESFHVLVTIPASEAFAPVRRITWFVAGVGTLIVGGFLLAGFYLASRKIIAPIESLRAIAEHVEAAAGNPKEARALAARLPEELGRITSHDELGDLAATMGSMARRVLGYQGRLEREISAKTAEMSRDLQFARDFQRSLMPHEYPVLPMSPSGLRVRFHHVYQPASSVGGDYFDLLRLSNSRVGVFVADVMGHGARSALVTAILATLMQDYEKEAHNPAELLRMLNSHFYDLISGGEDVLFVTAIHLVVDVANDRVEWATAGHPSPIVANRETGSTAPLFEDLSHNPALGIFPDSTYDLNQRAIKGGEVFFLFTDGVIEAADERGNEFGRQRVCKIIEQNLDRPVQEINEAVYKEIVSCQTGANAQDDICLVAIDLAREVLTAQMKG